MPSSAPPVSGRRRSARPRWGAMPGQPTPRGIGVVLVGGSILAVALATGTRALLPIAAAAAVLATLAPPVALTRARRARQGVVVAAEVSPMSTPVGSQAWLRLTVTNRSTGRCPPLCLQPPVPRWHPKSSEQSPRRGRRGRGGRSVAGIVAPHTLLPLRVPTPGGSEVVTIPVPTAMRGVFVLPATPTWARDPLGLFAAPGPKVPTVTVVVHPRRGPGASWPSAGPSASVGQPGQIDTDRRDGSGDLVGLRPYVVGDRLSLVHWPARARYGTWFVRQFAPEVAPTARLVLDDRAGVHRRRDFETMLSTAQGFVEEARAADRPIELHTFSGASARLTGERRAYEEALVLLASLRPRRGARTAIPPGVVLTTVTGARTLPETVPLWSVGT